MTQISSSSGTSYSATTQIVISFACGLFIANIYYAQPLTGLIGSALGMPPESFGLLVTFPLAGYGLGLLLVAPLGDLLENRMLVAVLAGTEAVSLLALFFIDSVSLFLVVSFFSGLAAASVQVLMPYASFIAPENLRSSAVGRAVSGMMLGIMLARPVSSFVTQAFGWRAIFGLSFIAMASLAIALRVCLPRHAPTARLTYRALLSSMGRILVSNEVLRRRSFYHACMFGAFAVFWTAIPLLLSSPAFGMSQNGIAWVALAGVAGAVAPPFAGRLADAGHTRVGTKLAMVFASATFVLPLLAPHGSPCSIVLVVATGIILDFSVSANLVFGQRAIYGQGSEQRARLNGLFVALFFVGGSIGSALSGWLYTRFGWTGVTVIGMALPLIGLTYFSTERKQEP